MAKFYQNSEYTYIETPLVDENCFINREPEIIKLPEYTDIKEQLPKPMWEGHEDVIACYDKAWKIAFSNLRNPQKNTGFVAPFIDTAFNGCLFMWDSSFILMFGKYASRIFDFQQTLDNFYSHQHKDGFISREICELDGSEKFTRHEHASTGPNIMPWCEYEYYKFTGNAERLGQVFPVLLAYHKWLKEFRTWRDGSYWACGWSCGMDNMPRKKGTDLQFTHGRMIWLDTCLQQILSDNILIAMADMLGHREDVLELEEERKALSRFINEKMWDENSKFYYDMLETDELNMVKSIGAYWALLADVVPKERLHDFVMHLESPKEFKRKHRIPTLSADDPDYDEHGDYWKGSVWAPTNYMVLKGLEKKGYHDIAFDIALNCVKNVAENHDRTKTIWENYAPDSSERGSVSKKDFVGWSGLFPISMLIEYVFGIKTNMLKKEIDWHIHLTEEFEIERYPYGEEGVVDFKCLKRTDRISEPEVIIHSNIDITVNLFWDNGSKVIKVRKSEN